MRLESLRCFLTVSVLPLRTHTRQREHFHMLLHQLCSIQCIRRKKEQRAGGAMSPEGEPAATVAAALPPAAGAAAAGLSLAARKAVKSASSSCKTVQK